jgi:pSer/pThr/pTyr-binding forkhead associated (FHA) protein
VQQRPITVRVASGHGLIARFGEVVMYVGSTEEATAELLAAAESAARAPQSGDTLPERLATVARAVPLGIVAPSAAGLLVLLRGAVTAEIQTLAGKQKLSGDRAMTMVRKTMPDDVLEVGIFSATHRVRRATAHTDLKAGVVPGGGFVLLQPQPESNAVATQRISSDRRAGQRGQQGLPQGRPARPLTETAMPTAVSAVLAAKDGAVYTLDRAYVIGRSPFTDESVRSATASPIVLPNDPHVSRVHAYITVDRGAVFVRDASTHAGTFIAAPGSETWTRIGETPTRLEHGWSLRIGEWIVTHRA